MFAALIRLFMTAMAGEGGGMAAGLGRAGMTEGLAEQTASKQGLAKGGDAALDKLHTEGKELMKHWVTADRGSNARTTAPQMQKIADAIHSGGGAKGPPPPNTGNAPKGQPDPSDKQSQLLQKQANQLQAKNNQQQAQANRGWGSWINAQQKAFLVQQALSYATFTLLDAFGKLRESFLKANPAAGPKGFFAFVSKMVDIGLILPRLAMRLNDFAEGISESNRNLARWNGTLLASFIRLDIRRLQAERRTGGEAQGSTVLLNETLGDLVDAVQPLQADVTIISNVLATGAALLAKITAHTAKGVLDITGISGILKMIDDKLKDLGLGPNDPNNRAGLVGLRRGAVQDPAPIDRLGGAIPRQPLPRRLAPNRRIMMGPLGRRAAPPANGGG